VTTIEHEVWIDADADRVFAALTTQEDLDAWWGKVVSAEPAVGSIIEFDHGLGEPLLMEITELVPNQRVAWTCVSNFDDSSNPASEWGGTQLTFELSPRAPADLIGRKRDVTILRFAHAGWAEDARWRAFCNTGWGVTLDRGLKSLCEQAA
jgi:uncharacterized protein YndB with AHSA1/START domain